MIFVADVGNTNTVYGVFDGDKIVCESRIDTRSAIMCDQYAIVIVDILRLYGVDISKIDGGIISSVVPPVTKQLKGAVEKIFKCKAMVVEPGMKTGLNIKIDDPSSLGADLACGAVAARHLYKLPCIIIDLGTANKIFAVDEKGAMLGGIIAPGIKISLEALSNQTAALPLISTERVDHVIGTNTIDSMRAGTLIGTACMIDGMIERFEKELGCPAATVVATGGFSKVIKPYCKHKFTLNPDLILQGMRIIYNKNL